MRISCAPVRLAVALLALSALPLAAVPPGLGLDRVAFGPLFVHDHVAFDFHQPALGDPFPHAFRQGYGFDGADLALALGWHWGRFHSQTFLRVTPLARSHWAYDQDSDLRPGTVFTHGNAGLARSRTFGLGEQWPLGRQAELGSVALRIDFLRQWTRYHAVTTYDLNSNPALPSRSFSRLISERAIVEELRPDVVLDRSFDHGPWAASVSGALAPLAWVEIRNYIPVVLGASATVGYGASARVGLTRRLSRTWSLQMVGITRWENGYTRQKYYRREQFALRLDLVRLSRMR